MDNSIFKIEDKVVFNDNPNGLAVTWIPRKYAGKFGTVIRFVKIWSDILIDNTKNEIWCYRPGIDIFPVNDISPKINRPLDIKTVPCPLCGTQGEDLVFAFYCYNEQCKNYKKFSYITDNKEDDLSF